MSIIGEGFAGVATAGTRVVEMYSPREQRLFDDRVGYRLLPLVWRVFLRLAYLPGLRSRVLSWRERRMPGSLGAILCRTRYLDDVLSTSLAQGLDQVVILGAGFDSRAYRIPGMDRVRVFEVDLPGARDLKHRRVARVLGAVPAHVTLLGVDLDTQPLDNALTSAGFQTGKRTLFLWEGVTQYITAEAVSNTLACVSRVSGVGSTIVFTYVRRDLVDGPDRPVWVEPFLTFAERVGSPWMFGLDPDNVEQYLADHGLQLVSDVGAADYQDLYLKPLGREMSVFDGERVAYARVRRPSGA